MDRKKQICTHPYKPKASLDHYNATNWTKCQFGIGQDEFLCHWFASVLNLPQISLTKRYCQRVYQPNTDRNAAISSARPELKKLILNYYKSFNRPRHLTVGQENLFLSVLE